MLHLFRMFTPYFIFILTSGITVIKPIYIYPEHGESRNSLQTSTASETDERIPAHCSRNQHSVISHCSL